ncbi:MAG TPA: damage-inducible protein CinA [Rhodobacteraceae bacterium]|jgi:nicotinamide-nucleotide amidase|nr:damage-inducible protein CinA [Paracoccaceae bacterium]
MNVNAIIRLARDQQIKLATAESCTGGLVAAKLTEQPGSSEIFECGFVTYSNLSKIQLLGVSERSLEQHGAVSEQVAGEMALGALNGHAAQLAVSITGIAGPGGSDFKPDGRVCFGVAHQTKLLNVEIQEFGSIGRDAVRQAARDHALHLFRAALESFQIQMKN